MVALSVLSFASDIYTLLIPLIERILDGLAAISILGSPPLTHYSVCIAYVSICITYVRDRARLCRFYT